MLATRFLSSGETQGSEGTPQCTLTLLLEEAGKDGATYKLFVPVDVFGTHAEWVAEHINAGDRVLLDGKFRWRSWIDKAGEKQGKLGVMGWQVSLLQPSAAAVSAN